MEEHQNRFDCANELLHVIDVLLPVTAAKEEHHG
jgi:hypothetical protein